MSDAKVDNTARSAQIAGLTEAAVYAVGKRLGALNAIAVPAYASFFAAMQSEQAKAVAAKSPDLKEQLPTILKAAEVVNKGLQASKANAVIAAFRVAEIPK